MKIARQLVFISLVTVLLMFGETAYAQVNKPNILVIWGDDIGIDNISAYNLGMMGYQTPNIDRLARANHIGVSTLRGHVAESCAARPRPDWLAVVSGQPEQVIRSRLCGLAGDPTALKQYLRRPLCQRCMARKGIHEPVKMLFGVNCVFFLEMYIIKNGLPAVIVK